jgi:hypothetical protein
MATQELGRSRRALLTAAAGAAGAFAAGALIPASVAAAPAGLLSDVENQTAEPTSVKITTPDSTAFIGAASGAGSGFGLQGTTTGGGTSDAPGAAGVVGFSTAAPKWTPAFTPQSTGLTGVFGYAPQGEPLGNTFGSGVWGDSPDTGVLGTGGIGVEGFGFVAVLGHANNNAGSVGVHAFADGPTSTALVVEGKAHFSRSGRTAIARGKSSLRITLAGTTPTSKVFAVLATSLAEHYVRAVVPATDAFTIHLNVALASKAYVNWFVLD